MSMDEPVTPTPRRRAALKNTVATIILVTITVLVIFFSPIRTLMPGYLTPQSRAQVVSFAMRVDSLEEAVARQNLYVTNLQDILSGRVMIDSVTSIDTLTALRASDLMEQTEREKEFVRQFEEAEKYNLTTQASRVSNVSGLNLVVPVRGTVQKTFDPDNYHYGIEVIPVAHAAIVAALDGTVLQSGYTVNDGYSIVIQHNGDLVTLYSHCGMLVHKVGDRVKAGEAIASAAAFDEDEQVPGVHFELWHKGVALDPSVYIAF